MRRRRLRRTIFPLLVAFTQPSYAQLSQTLCDKPCKLIPGDAAPNVFSHEKAVVVAAGQNVIARYREGNLTISSPAIALNGGRSGDTVSVMFLDDRRRRFGRVDDDGGISLVLP